MTRRRHYIPARRSPNPWIGVGWIVLALCMLILGGLAMFGVAILGLLAHA